MKIEDLKEKGVPEGLISEFKKRGISVLDPLQVNAIEKGLFEGDNLLILGPTSLGKTLVGELALIKKAISGEKGCFYVVSHKALAEEKYKLFYEAYESKGWFNIAITTGDRNRFDQNLGGYGVVIATYEKLSSLLIANPDLINSVKLVVVDEIQTLGDDERGPTLETLLIRLKEKKTIQLIGLSATILQPEILADWLNSKLVANYKRSVELEETIWCKDRIISKDFNTKKIIEQENPLGKVDTIEIVKYLKGKNHFPLIVFCMTKNQVETLANLYYELCSEDFSCRELVNSIKDVSEGTPTSRSLCRLLSRGIGIHTADLNRNEKEIVETAFANRIIQVIFATTTLSTGINLPAKTVLIDDCCRDWADCKDIEVHEYINMSGRAGRRGLQEKGTSIILAKNKAQEESLLKYLNHDLAELKSQLKSKRYGFDYHISHLISSKTCKTIPEILDFFDKSFFNYKFKITNQIGRDVIKPIVEEQTRFLLEYNLLKKNYLGELEITEYGKIAVKNQLLPRTLLFLKAFLDKLQNELNKDNFDNFIPQILYLTTLTREFSEGNCRFYIKKEEQMYFITQEKGFNFWGLDQDPVNFKTMFVLNEFIKGAEYDKLCNFGYVVHGKISNAAACSSWIIEALGELVALPDYGFSEETVKKFFVLSQRVKFGVPENAVELARLFFEEQIKSVSRAIAIKLASQGINSVAKVMDMRFDNLSKIVGPKNAENILEGIIRFVRSENLKFKMIHETRARNLSRGVELISNLYTSKGRDFETAVINLLKSIDIKCEQRDVGHAESEPDILVYDNNEKIPIECKTRDDETKAIGSTEAFEIFGKGLIYNQHHLVTIGKPLFSQAAIDKKYPQVTLMLHICLAELIIQAWEGKLTKDDVINTFKRGGYIKIEQIKQDYQTRIHS